MIVWVYDCVIYGYLFIYAPLNSEARVYTFRHQKHASSLYRSDFSIFMPKWLVSVWLCDFRIIIYATLNSPTRVDPYRDKNHVSRIYGSNFSRFIHKWHILVWLCDFRIFIDVPLNSPVWVLLLDTKIMSLVLIDLI